MSMIIADYQGNR